MEVLTFPFVRRFALSNGELIAWHLSYEIAVILQMALNPELVPNPANILQTLKKLNHFLFGFISIK